MVEGAAGAVALVPPQAGVGGRVREPRGLEARLHQDQGEGEGEVTSRPGSDPITLCCCLCTHRVVLVVVRLEVGREHGVCAVRGCRGRGDRARGGEGRREVRGLEVHPVLLLLAAAAAAAGHRLKTERKPRVQEMLRCWAGLGAGHVTSPANGGARPVAGGSVHTRHHQLATSPHREAEGIVMIGLLFIHFNLALFQLFNAAASFHVMLAPPSIS